MLGFRLAILWSWTVVADLSPHTRLPHKPEVAEFHRLVCGYTYGDSIGAVEVGVGVGALITG